MTFTERDTILQNEDYIGRVRISFYDWLEYWSVTGTSSITDPDKREQTDLLIKMALDRPDNYVNKLAVLAISEPAVKDAVEVTDANVNTAVVNLLAHALPYLI
jgi:hypothetical protein